MTALKKTPGRTNVIPFPGLSLDADNSLQNTLDSFLQEMGYADATEVRGRLQSDGFQNELESFLQQMGYVE